MDMRRAVAVAQKAGKYFLHALEFACAVIGLVAFFTTVPPVIAVPIAVGVGVFWGVVGGKKESEELDEEEQRRKQSFYLLENIVKMQGDVQHLKEDVKEVVSGRERSGKTVTEARYHSARDALESAHQFNTVMHDPIAQEFTLFNDGKSRRSSAHEAATQTLTPRKSSIAKAHA